MKIAMFTNTYLPHIGGVARSVKTLEDECRKRGHEVKIIAPQSDTADESPDVFRVPAIQHFNGSDFSFRLPIPTLVRDFIEDFKPDIIHSHHPFLLGDAAIREAWKIRRPIVFTHHTLYERYTHYVPLDSDALKRVAIQLATEYCNLCSHVIAPSESIEHLLVERGVTVPIQAIPTGIETHTFASADGDSFRAHHGIPAEAVVIGHIGRLAEEKNLRFLAQAAKEVLTNHPDAWFLLVGDGPEKETLLGLLEPDRVVAPGALHGGDLAAAYAAMDVFLFASQSETQGMVLAEAMAAGTPVVALDGCGVREIMEHEANGLMLPSDASTAEFSKAINRLIQDDGFRNRCAAGASATASSYDLAVTTDAVISLYETLVANAAWEKVEDLGPWDRLLNGIGVEWDLTVGKLSALAAVVSQTPATEAKID